MPVKINKEMLIKHRFWVMLGVAMTLTLTGILCLQFVNADEFTDNLKKAIAAVKNITGPQPNQAVVDSLAKESTKANDSESKVWRAAYAAQQDIFKFSDEIEKEFHFYDGLFATEIKLTKGTDPKQWPQDKLKDSPTLVVHGKVVDINGQISFKLQTRTGDLTFYNTPGLSKITFTDDKDNSTTFNEMMKYMKDRYAAVTFQRGRYFGDTLTADERRVFADTYRPSLPNAEIKCVGQIHPILKLVDPLDEQGNGVVQLKDWLYTPDRLPYDDVPGQRFINYVKVPWDLNVDPVKFSKGAWIAQEDLWVQKEIYRIIGETNDTVSVFDKQKNPGKDKVEVFKNSYFELNLVLQPDDTISFTIKNLLPRRQRLDQSFIIKTSDALGLKPETILFSGDPLMPKGDAGKGDTATKTFTPPKDGTKCRGFFDVRQQLTWETAAIKRIDQISIGSAAAGEISHGHRTFIDGLFPFLASDIGAADDLGVPGIVPGSPANKGPAGPGGFPKKGGPPVKAGPARGAQGGGANIQRIPHDLWLTRYAEISDQSRRIPVAISLIIDQDHVDRVLTHFNNSKLRFLETQVILNQYPSSLQPPAPVDRADPAVKRPGGPGRIIRPNMPAGPGAQAGSPGGSADMETNMELVIYGIMTLYNRYPPRPVAAAAPGAAPPAAAPPPGAAPPGGAPPAKDR